jgi:hypothetical protein
VQLRGGFETQDPRLDRVPQFDEKSRGFQIRTRLETVSAGRLRRSGTFRPGATLDQGREGACVGFGGTHYLQGLKTRYSHQSASTARSLYLEAQKVDEWSGEAYEGTSVLAAMKVLKTWGRISAYDWVGAGSGTVIDDCVDTWGYVGGIVFGLPWMASMFKPRPSGLMEVDMSSLSGGHCIYAPGVRLKARLRGEGSKPLEVGVFQNSWGHHWGVPGYQQPGGFCYIRLEDLEKLLESGGEGAVPHKVAPPRATSEEVS